MYILSLGQDAAPDHVLYSWFHTKEIPVDNRAHIPIAEVDQGWMMPYARSKRETGAACSSKCQRRIVTKPYYAFLDHENA